MFLDNNIPKRLDLSSKFFEQFGKKNESIRKQVGLYEFENTEHGICNLRKYDKIFWTIRYFVRSQ